MSTASPGALRRHQVESAIALYGQMTRLGKGDIR